MGFLSNQILIMIITNIVCDVHHNYGWILYFMMNRYPILEYLDVKPKVQECKRHAIHCVDIEHTSSVTD